MPTTTITFRVVIDHTSALPAEGGALEKRIATSLLTGQPEITGARVSQVMRRPGEPHLPADVPAKIPEVEAHRAEPFPAPIVETYVIGPGGEMSVEPPNQHNGQRPRNPIPDPVVCTNGGQHDFNPAGANRGRVCPRCGAQNPSPPMPRRNAKPEFKDGTLME